MKKESYIENLQKQWDEIEPETPEHLMTVLDVFAHQGNDNEMTPESLGEAVAYIESWVKYRSSFVRSLFKNNLKK